MILTRNPADDNIPVFGRTRNGPPPPPEATTHPLLLDASASSNRVAGSQARGARQSQRLVAGGNTELMQTIEELVGGGAFQLFHHIMTRGRGGGGPETIRLDVPAGMAMNLDRGYLQQRRHGVIQAVRVERTPRPPQNPTQGRDLDPLLTLQRWAEEVKILHGDFVAERAGKLANHVALALLPAAVEAAKQAKIREEEEETARQRELQAIKEEEEARKAQEEVKHAAEEAAKRELEQGDNAATTAEEATAPEPAAPPTEVSTDQAMEDVPASTADVDTEMIDATPLSDPVPTATETVIPEPAAASSSTAEGPGEPSSSGAQGSSAVERVTVMIHGSAVDITDTGIDPTFLEALPDDMREEVLNQHVRDQRASQIERPPDSQISAEFLDALPAELRAEIIQQEAIERSRRRAEEAATGTAGAPAEIDHASFIASLDPNLRQAVLLDQDEGFIQTLPAHMIAEAGMYREGQPRLRLANRHGAPRAAPPGSSAPRKFSPHHDAIQLLDKTGVAILIRLLFFPQVLRKTLLFRVLVNLCENAKTRTELFNLLLSILQDGTGDLTAVDKSFSQMSMRNIKTPKALGKQKQSDYFSALALPNSQSEAVPDLIAQRCLEALTFIVTANPLSSLFFLTEHELSAGLRRAASKKGKGKEKQQPQTHYPIVLLLGLLDRQSLLRTPSIMESVVGVLATVTRPLTSIKDGKKQLQLEPSSSATAPVAPTYHTTATAVVVPTPPGPDSDTPDMVPFPNERPPARSAPSAPADSTPAPSDPNATSPSNEQPDASARE